MIIVSPDTGTQQIDVYVRSHTDLTYSVEIVNEHTKKATTQSVTGTYDGTSFVFDVVYQFEKERWYMMKLFAGVNLINTSKIYCTDQSDYQKYSVLDGYYHQIDKPKHEYIIKE